MTELKYIETELKNLIRDLEVNKAHCPDDWDDCDERTLDLQKRIYRLFFSGDESDVPDINDGDISSSQCHENDLIRCKDCKWWGRKDTYKDGSTMIVCKKGWSTSPEGYCHHAERRISRWERVEEFGVDAVCFLHRMSMVQARG